MTMRREVVWCAKSAASTRRCSATVIQATAGGAVGVSTSRSRSRRVPAPRTGRRRSAARRDTRAARPIHGAASSAASRSSASEISACSLPPVAASRARRVRRRASGRRRRRDSADCTSAMSAASAHDRDAHVRRSREGGDERAADGMDERRSGDQCERCAEDGRERKQSRIFGGRLTLDARHRRPDHARVRRSRRPCAMTASPRSRAAAQHDVAHGAVVDRTTTSPARVPGRDRVGGSDPRRCRDRVTTASTRMRDARTPATISIARCSAPGWRRCAHPCVLGRAVDDGDLARFGRRWSAVGERSLDERSQRSRRRPRRRRCDRGASADACARRAASARRHRRSSRRRAARARDRRGPVPWAMPGATMPESACPSTDASGGPRRTTPRTSTAARATAAAMSAIVSTLACARSRMPPRCGRCP